MKPHTSTTAFAASNAIFELMFDHIECVGVKVAKSRGGESHPFVVLVIVTPMIKIKG